VSGAGWQLQRRADDDPGAAAAAGARSGRRCGPWARVGARAFGGRGRERHGAGEDEDACARSPARVQC